MQARDSAADDTLPWPRRRAFMCEAGMLAAAAMLPELAWAKNAMRILDFRCGLPRGIRFERASAAYVHATQEGAGALGNVTHDAPRFLGKEHNCQGLLLEGAAKNRVKAPLALSPKAFALSNGGDASAAPNEKGPDGSGGVIKLHRGAAGSNSIVDLWVAPAPDGDFCTASVWLRSPGSAGTWRLRLIDFTTYNGQTTVAEVGTEWKRFSVTLPLHLRDTGARRFALALSDPATKPGAATDPRKSLTDVLMWGPQVESGSDATSFIPGGETFRAADVALMPSAWLPGSGGITVHLPQGGRRGAVVLDEGGEERGIRLAYSNSGWLMARVGGVQATGFGDCTADTWLRLEWSPAGVQILSGKSEAAMSPQASSANKPARLELGEQVRLGMDVEGRQALNRPLALVKIGGPLHALAATRLPSLVPAGYRISFEDDFNDTNLARINENAVGGKPGAPAWRSRYRQARTEIINDEKQIYVDPEYAGSSGAPLGIQPFSISDSILTISADRAPAAAVAALGGRRFTSGCITTELTHWQTYGYFEMRARQPRGKGFWPAFWLLPKRDTWPPEIDVLEGSGARPRSVHVGFIDRTMKYKRDTGAWVENEIDVSDGFHIFALEWTRDAISYFVDGKQVFTLGPHGIHEDMYLLANLALGSKDAGWIPNPDETTPFPGKFEIDYIRAWSRHG